MPVVVEIILERVTNISMGTEIDTITEFEELAERQGRRADRDRAARLAPIEASAVQPLTDESGETMPKFAANLTMLFNEVAVPRPLRARRAMRASEAVEYLFPYAYPTAAARRAPRSGNGLTQVLHNLPAGDWDGRRARHRVPARTASASSGRRRHGDRVRERARRAAGQLPGRHRAGGRRCRSRLRATFVDEPALRRREARSRPASGC